MNIQSYKGSVVIQLTRHELVKLGSALVCGVIETDDPEMDKLSDEIDDFLIKKTPLEDLSPYEQRN